MTEDLHEGDKTGQWRDYLKSHAKKALSQLSREYPHKRSLVIDYQEVTRWNKVGLELADEILENPGKVIEDITDAILSNELVRPTGEVKLKARSLHIRFVHLPKKTRIRDIRVNDVNRMATVEGMIVRISEVRPRIIEAVFRCPAGHFTNIQQKFSHFKEPEKCSSDGCKFKRLDLLPKRSVFVDSQTGQIQENLEGQRPGEQPQKLVLDMEDDLCGLLVPGERVILNGIIRSSQQNNRGEKSTRFDIFLEVNSIEHDQKNYGEIEISDEEEAEIMRLSKEPDLLGLISQSILPAISGLADEKKGIALHLFSPRQDISCGKKLRGSVHLFFGGDPGISKSTMMQMLQAITPRSIYISGKSTSSAGLTFAMRQDDHDKRWVVDAGAAVMADESNLFVDELAQMEKADIMALNEFMETQIIPVAKAGVSATLQARCSVMVALNPKFGRFDMAGAPLADQIDSKIPPQLLSRFDLIYLIPDVPEEVRDRKEAEDIMGIWQGKMIETQNQIPLPLLQKYIALAKRRKNPKINDAAKRIIVDQFVQVRKYSGQGNVSVTKRALECLARLATAHAIMRFGNEVSTQDAEAAVKVFEYSQRMVCVDPSTGQYSADRVTGQTKEKRKLHDLIIDAIKGQGGKASMDVICREVKAIEPGLIENKIMSAIEQMAREGALMEPSHGKYSAV